MYLHKTPALISKIYPSLLWHKDRGDKSIYLTFDDGPIPEVTPFAIKQLQNYQAKATFFCVGENIERNPDVLNQLINSGHAIGNHSHNHLNGKKHSNATYFKNIECCQQSINAAFTRKTKFFRPPYGRIKHSQIKELKKHYQIVMWDVLSGDFDSKLSPEKCLRSTIEATQPGSVVVFHDNLKATDRLYYALPLFLKHFSEKGYKFKSL